MCGIAGVVSFSEAVDEGALRRMNAALAHRGPDDEGVCLGQTGGFSFGLGNRRLAILDLSPAGHQPMAAPDAGCWITFNGEVYNHRELRRELELLGHTFRSTGDTEVVLHACQEWGLDALSRLEGIFAFAFVDGREGSLLLARDRMGVKPLYYAWDGSQLVFASEVGAVLASGVLPQRLDPAGLNALLALGYVPAPHTLVAGLRKLRAGHHLLLQGGAKRTRAYWRPEQGWSSDGQGEPVLRLREALEGAVRRQLFADVPVGVLLSGGVDSVIIASLAHREQAQPLHTFSIGYQPAPGSAPDVEQQNEDLAQARAVARRLRSYHHEVLLDADSFPERYARLLGEMDEPFHEPVFVSQYELCRLAREAGVKVVLTGDGADELFGGYGFYALARRAERLSHVPLLTGGLGVLKGLFGWSPLGARAGAARRAIADPYPRRYAFAAQVFSPEERRRLLADGLAGDGYGHVFDFLEGVAERPWPDAMLFADSMLMLREHYNARLDAVSMLNSVEARVPFQDEQVVELALALSATEKCPHGEAKGLLRRACADLLPAAVSQRPKRAFQVPADGWLRHRLAAFARETLAPERLRAHGLFDAAAVERCLAQQLHGSGRSRSQLWVLLGLQHWWEAHLQRPAAPSPVPLEVST